MKFLAIDTTAERLTVALNADGKVFSRDIEVGKSGHSKILLPTVSEVLNAADAKINDVDVIAAVVGVGSFTGIRIGIAAMTALCFATGAKRISVTSFDIIAYNRAEVTVSVDAGHGNLYLAHCVDGKTVSTAFVAADDAGVLDTSGFVTKPLGNAVETLNSVVIDKISRGEYVQTFEPFYMRKSQAERTKEESEAAVKFGSEDATKSKSEAAVKFGSEDATKNKRKAEEGKR